MMPACVHGVPDEVRCSQCRAAAPSESSASPDGLDEHLGSAVDAMYGKGMRDLSGLSK